MKKFLTEKLNSALNYEYTKIIDTVSKQAKMFEVEAYIIGGVVRDLILNKPIYDVDFVIQGNAITFCKFMEQNNIRRFWHSKSNIF